MLSFKIKVSYKLKLLYLFFHACVCMLKDAKIKHESLFFTEESGTRNGKMLFKVAVNKIHLIRNKPPV